MYANSIYAMPLSTSGQAGNATKEKEKRAHQKARQHTAEWFHLIGINAVYFSKFACAAFREYIDDKLLLLLGKKILTLIKCLVIALRLVQ
ncbi:unnamed protein product [Ceratitis capitata]|uniref:(Mediterranean fruit fly) hypothetical protein n=1 Tax=Ceratitis capitata TaxID=7213 RepID=A0A811UZ46_CERCA|nr:unnamed protein product [Ceratitis capitata]